MCLIAYSKDGKDIPRHALDFAVSVNPDGIGVMSSRGVEKFFGKKFYKRARFYLRSLSGTPHAVHLRWTTHGAKCLELCHPFNVPNTDIFVMHNGVIRSAERFMSANDSDTSAFVREEFGFRDNSGFPAYGTADYKEYLEEVEKYIGWSNKLVVLHAGSGQFSIVNESAGHWKDGVWYSNYYSLPWDQRSATAFDDDGDTTPLIGARWQYGRGYLGGRDNGRFGRPYGVVSSCAIVPAGGTATGSTVVALRPANSGSDYTDSNVSDAIDGGHRNLLPNPTARRVFDYYADVAREAGYHDDGAELGARAARAACGRVWSDQWPQHAVEAAEAALDGAMVVHSED